jgi:autotransporter-associated beta strand protein
MKRKMKQSGRQSMVLAAAVLGLWPTGQTARAALRYWDINGATAGAGGISPGGTWNAANTNWSSDSGGAVATAGWTNGNTAVFSAGTDATGAFTVLVGGISTAGLTFEEGTVTLNGSLDLSGSTIDVASGLTAELQSAVSGTVGLTKVNAGTLKLTSGTSTFTGTVNVNAGTLDINADARLGNSANGVTINGGTLLFHQTFSSSRVYTLGASGGTISVATGQTATLNTGLAANANTLAYDGPGTLALAASSTRTGTTNTNGGVLRLSNASALGSGTVSINGGGVFELSVSGATMPVNLANLGTIRAATGTGPSYSGTITAASSAPTLTLDSGNIGLTVSSYAGGTGSNTIVSGSGVLILPNADTYAGSWQVNGGTLRVGNSAALGSGTSSVVVNTDGILELTSATLPRAVTLNPNSTLRTFLATATTTEPVTVISQAGANVTLGGTNTTSLTIGDSPNDLTGGLGSTITVRTVANTGKIVLNQPSDYAGSWTILLNSTLEIDADNHLGNAGNSVDIQGGRLRATGTFSSAKFITGSNFGRIEVTAGNTLTLSGGVGATFPNTLIKEGDGTLVLSASSAQDGNWSVGGGIVRLQNASAAGSGSLSIGTTLEIDNVSINNAVSLGTFGTLLGTGTASATGFVTVSGSNFSPSLATGTSPSDVLTIAPPNGLTGGGASSSITVFGSGTVTLASPGTYTGEWDLDSGVLQIGADDRLGNAANTLFFNGGTLRTSAAVISARNIFVEPGGGTINTNGFDSTFGNVTDPGTLVKNAAGKLTINHVRNGGLTIHAGTVAIAPNGAAPGTSLLNTLTIDAGAKFDLTDNKLIVTGGNVAALTALITAGRNGGGWGGSGIVTSQTAATSGNFTSIGVARASDVRPNTATETTIWAGQTITGTDTLVMYTYGGDATLDGKINIDDYVRIDQGINAQFTGWSNGDFNYDGKVNIDDYTTVIDANIGNQNGVFFTGGGIGDGGSGVAAVPEPAVGSLLVIPALALLRRRRSR